VQSYSDPLVGKITPNDPALLPPLGMPLKTLVLNLEVPTTRVPDPCQRCDVATAADFRVRTARARAALGRSMQHALLRALGFGAAGRQTPRER
jgi:hypothetical protein